MDPQRQPWRTGRKVGRTIYVQTGDEPSDEDPMELGRKLAADADRMVDELICAGRTDLAWWPMAVARGARERNERLRELSERRTRRWLP